VSRAILLLAIRDADAAGFVHFAQALRAIYRKEFGGEAR